MAKDKPVIHKSVNLGGVKYTAGMEDELEAAASKEEMQHYTNRGTVSGFGATVQKGYETRSGREKLEAKARLARRADRVAAAEKGAAKAPAKK